MDGIGIAATVRRLISVPWRITVLARSTAERFYPWDRRPCPVWRHRREAGSHGEKVAARFLERAGLKILARNYRSRHGEVDLVARHGRELVMVEVKARHPRARLAPEHSVTWGKQRKILGVANAYLRELRLRPPAVRFDIVEVWQATGEIPRCRWIRKAFSQAEVGLEWSR
ncbi:MAG: YraN family protein [Verrucomicrobia bacterium]|nr:YraN family protein [Verrucomicrobiota bacterium]